MNRRGTSFSLACTLVPLGVGIAVATPPWHGWAVLGPAAGAFLAGAGTAFAAMAFVKDPSPTNGADGPAIAEAADPVLLLRERIRSDYNNFVEHFSPTVRGRRLEADLQWLETQLQDRLPQARDLIQQVRAEPIRTAAREFYGSWNDLVAHYDEAVDRAQYAKRHWVAPASPTPEDMWAHAQESLEAFLAVADVPVPIDAKPA